ncbi:MAG: hypothetical protein M1541_06845, partial [Acidobacteria bacterium]|nr:hypothetical protein [Acidobacteriota bacterium]
RMPEVQRRALLPVRGNTFSRRYDPPLLRGGRRLSINRVISATNRFGTTITVWPFDWGAASSSENASPSVCPS